MGFWKGLACVVGGIGAIVAAPIVLPVLAGAAATAGAAAAGVAAAAGSAVASTAVGSAVVGAASTVAGAAAAAGTAVASSAVGTAVVGAASTVAGAASAAGAAVASSAVGTAVAGAVSSVGSVAASGCGLIGVTTTSSAAVAAGVVGSGMTYSALTINEAFSNFDSAKRMIEEAKFIFEKKSKELDNAIEKANQKLTNLTLFKLQISANEIKDSVLLLKKIRNTQAKSSDYSDGELSNDYELKIMEEGTSLATGVLNKIDTGLSLRNALPMLTQNFVRQFGLASTGTSISSLSGAAAQRATLAALGGGSLQAGGAGMAGGQIMLGGLSLVPTAVLLAWQMASNSEKALTEAYEYYCKITKEAEGIDSQKVFVKEGVVKRIEEIDGCLGKLKSVYALRILPALRLTIEQNQGNDGRVDFKACPSDTKNSITLATHFLRTIRKVMEVKVLDDNGRLDENGKTLLDAVERDQKIQAVA